MNKTGIKILKGIVFIWKCLVTSLFALGIIAIIIGAITIFMEYKTPQEIIQQEYGECTFFDNKTFISDGKLYSYKYDKDGQLHVFYVEDVKDKVVTGK